MAGKKYTDRELEEYVTKLMTESEITLSKQKERIEELKRENEHLMSELSTYKKKDKASARALTLEERKSKYIQEVTKSRCAIEIDRLSRLAARYSELFDRLSADDQKQFEDFVDELNAAIVTLKNLNDYIDDRKPLSEAEKNYIAEKDRISLADAVKSDLDSRFSKLVNEFKIKIGDSATRKRGRPKKQDQSILVEVKRTIDQKAAEELSEKEKQEVIDKINEIFYTPQQNIESNSAQKSKKKKKSDGVFDFDEALNPTESLADIMNDL